ncbi:MAG: helix-turn-helix transcriptional regulator [Firmicutes bacterium]|nr:helix-turn-helix transcriptional regulator [Bacillota bacterium]
MKSENLTSIGQSIKAYRKKAKITQSELASLIGKTESSIRKYEKGLIQAPINVIEQISNVFGVTPYELMGAAYWDAKSPEIGEQVKRHENFVLFLESLDYAVEEESGFSTVPMQEVADQIPQAFKDEFENAETVELEEASFVLTHKGKTVTFTNAEFEELQRLTKEVIEARFYKKLLETKAKK